MSIGYHCELLQNFVVNVPIQKILIFLGSFFKLFIHIDFTD